MYNKTVSNYFFLWCLIKHTMANCGTGTNVNISQPTFSICFRSDKSLKYAFKIQNIERIVIA